MLSDEQLYENYLRGDDDALQTLLERYGDSLTLFLYHLVGNMADAEKLMMDAFAALLVKHQRFSRRSSFKTWLFGIGRNKSREFLRRKRLKMVPLEDVQLAAAEQELDLLCEERNRMLFSAMQQINRDYSEALFLYYFEDMNAEQIAKTMHITKRRSYDLLYRGKQALRPILEKEGFPNAYDR